MKFEIKQNILMEHLNYVIKVISNKTENHLLLRISLMELVEELQN